MSDVSVEVGNDLHVYHETGGGWMLAKWNQKQCRYEAIEPPGDKWAPGTVLWARTLAALYSEYGEGFRSRAAAMEYDELRRARA
jgi:hypothetical protein